MQQVQQIEKLRQLGRNNTPRQLSQLIISDAELKHSIRTLYKQIFKRELSGCINCVTDALFELTILKDNEIMEKLEQQFRLRAGDVVHDTNYDVSKLMSNVNISRQLALYHLAQGLDIDRFVEKPDNWQEMLIDYKNNSENNTHNSENTKTLKSTTKTRKAKATEEKDSENSENLTQPKQSRQARNTSKKTQ